MKKKEENHYIIKGNYSVTFKELLEHFLEKRETVGVSLEEVELVEAELSKFWDANLDQLTYKKLTGLDLSLDPE